MDVSVRCSGCGEVLPAEIVAAVWADTDFIEHGDHYAGWEPTPTNFAAARKISEEFSAVEL